MANGTYIWTLSDDDIVLDDCIEYIIDLINKYKDIKPSIIFIKPQFEKKENIDVLRERILTQKNEFTDDLFQSADKALIHINWLVSFVSAFVLRKDLISDKISFFFGSGFIHTPMILDCISQGNVIITNDVHILCRQNNSGGYNIYKYFGTNIMKIFNYYKDKNIFNSQSINRVIDEWLKCCVRGNVIYCKLNRNMSFELNNKISDLIIPYRNNTFFILKVLPILIMPNQLLKIISNWRKW